MKKSFIQIVGIMCLTLVGCDQVQRVKTKVVDSLFLDSEKGTKPNEIVVEQKEPTPLEIYKKHKELHDSGDLLHSYDVAMVLLEGKIVDKDEKTALKILESSMFSDERSKLHLFSHWIDTVNKDRFDLIFEVLNKDLHSKKESDLRYNLLAQVYEHSIGTTKNMQKAVEFHKKASKLENLDSKAWLDNYDKAAKARKEFEKQEAIEENLRLEKRALKLVQEAKMQEEQEALIAFEKEKRRIAEILKQEKEQEEEKEKIRLAEFLKQEEKEKSLQATLASTSAENSTEITTSSNRDVKALMDSETPLGDTELSFEELKQIEKTQGLHAVEEGYFKLALENNADVQEHLGAVYLEEEFFVKAVTFYFLASKHKEKSVNEKMEFAISKMTREEFEQAQKDIKIWIDKIKEYNKE